MLIRYCYSTWTKPAIWQLPSISSWCLTAFGALECFLPTATQPDVQTLQKQGRLCLAEPPATAIMQTLSQGQVDGGVCESRFRKPDSAEWTFISIRLSNKNILCQQLSIRWAGNSHPPAGFIQRLDSFSLRLDWHLLASIMGLKEGLEQHWQETEKRESLHNQKMVKDVTW